MVKTAAFLAALGLLGGAAAWVSPAAAQEAGPVHVLERQKPEYAPVGGRVGSFFIYPKAEVEGRYDSNVFATETDADGDFIGLFRPQVLVRSDWSRHALSARAGATIGRHAEFDSEDYEDFYLAGNGLLDVTSDFSLLGDLDLARRHEERGSPDDVNGETPTEYYDLKGRVRGRYRFSRLRLSGDSGVRYLDFGDVESSSGATIDNDDRDRVIYESGLQAGYEIVPDYLAFLRGEYSRRDYVTALDNGGVDRDSQGYDVEAGFAFPLSGITRAEVSAGWQEQFYEDPSLESIGGFSFGLALTWYATELTTVELEGERSIEETTLSGASGSLRSTLRLEVAHELRRNVVLVAGAGFLDDDFQGIERHDYFVNANVGARYLVNRRFYLGADYEYGQRESNASGADYSRSLFMLRGGVQF